MNLRVFLISTALAGTALAESAFRLSPVFSTNAVLQRDKPVAVWGLSESGDDITVEFAGQSKTAKAGADGRWLLRLDPLALSKEGRTLRAISARSGLALEAKNVVVGDVWFCSGQSNMNWTVWQSRDGEKELAAADYPLIRGIRTPLRGSEKPEFSVDISSWSVAQAGATPMETSTRSWSGVAYFFAREVHRKTGVPIGLIMSSYGGTTIEVWMDEAALAESGLKEKISQRWTEHLASVPELTEKWKVNLARWQQAAAEAEKKGEEFKLRKPRPPQGLGTRRQPAGLFNAMVAPFVPYGIRGFLWYQGESNAERHEEYAQLLATLIRTWRERFGQGDLPFYLVQLPNFGRPTERSPWSYLREAQESILDKVPNTGMAVTLGLGQAETVHPLNKQDVGDRLARIALKNVYRVEDIAADSPRFASAKAEGSAMVVSFRGNPKLELRGAGEHAFEVAGADRKFYPATAKIENGKLVVSAPQVSAPAAVRYAWWNNPDTVLFGPDGLPAAPFRSDDWPPENAAAPEADEAQ